MISFVLKRPLANVQGGSKSRRTLAGLQWILAAALLAVSAPVAADGPDRAERIESMESASFPSLAEVMVFAKERAPTVVTARMDVGVANASYAGARLAPIDNPYLEVFVDRGGGSATRDVAMQANLWLPIEMAGQQGRRIAEVDALVDWQKTRMESVQFHASGEAVRAYGDLLVTAERTRTLADIVQVASAEANFYAERLTAGDATLHDERLARVELGRTTILLEESRADLVRSKMRLSRAVGRSVDEPGPAILAAAPAPVEITETGAARTAAQSVHVRASEREADYFARSAERSAVEAHVPVNVIVTAGRGDLGEARVGAGLAWTFPVLRKNQGEQARARAERARALTEADVMRRLLGQTLQALHAERVEVRRALKTSETVTEPAARDSVEAVVVLKSAGKVDSLRVLTARRDLAMVRLRRLELLARDWAIVGDIVGLTGKLP